MQAKSRRVAIISLLIAFFTCLAVGINFGIKTDVKNAYASEFADFEEISVTTQEELISALSVPRSKIVFKNNIVVDRELGTYNNSHIIDFGFYCIEVKGNVKTLLEVNSNCIFLGKKDTIIHNTGSQDVDIVLGGNIELKDVVFGSSNSLHAVNLKIKYLTTVKINDARVCGSVTVTGNESGIARTVVEGDDLCVTTNLSVENATVSLKNLTLSTYNNGGVFDNKRTFSAVKSDITVFGKVYQTNQDVQYGSLLSVAGGKFIANEIDIYSLEVSDSANFVSKKSTVRYYAFGHGVKTLTLEKFDTNPNVIGYLDDLKKNGSYMLGSIYESSCKIFVDKAEVVKISGRGNNSLGRVRFNKIDSLILRDCTIEDFTIRNHVLPDGVTYNTQNALGSTRQTGLFNVNAYLTNVTVNCRYVVEKSSSLTLYSGTMNYGVCVTSGSSFYMYGGEVYGASGTDNTFGVSAVIVLSTAKFYMYGGKIEHKNPQIVTGEFRDMFLCAGEPGSASVKAHGYMDFYCTTDESIKEEWSEYGGQIEDDTPIFALDSQDRGRDFYDVSKIGLDIDNESDTKIYGGTIIGGVGSATFAESVQAAIIVEADRLVKLQNGLEGLFENMIDFSKSSKVTLGGENISSNDEMTDSGRFNVKTDYLSRLGDILTLMDNFYGYYYYCFSPKTLSVTNKKPNDYKVFEETTCDIFLAESSDLEVGDTVRVQSSYNADILKETNRKDFVEYEWSYSENGSEYKKIANASLSCFDFTFNTVGTVKFKLSIKYANGIKSNTCVFESQSYAVNPSVPVFNDKIKDVKGVAGTNVTLVSTATSSNDLEYQWYRGNTEDLQDIIANGSTMPEYAGGKAKNLTVNVNSITTQGAYFVCAVKSYQYINGVKYASDVVYSNVVRVGETTVDKPIVKISEQNSITTSVGQPIILTVDATCDNGNLSYFWELKNRGVDNEWFFWIDSETTYGRNNPVYYMNFSTPGRYQIRCKVTNTLAGASVTVNSGSYLVTVLPLPPVEITDLTEDQFLSQKEYATAPLSFTADNKGLGEMSYQWQTISSSKSKDLVKDDEGWTNVANNGNSTVYNVSLTSEMNRYYRCIITNTYKGNNSYTYTDPIKVSVVAEPKIDTLNIVEGLTIMVSQNERDDNTALEYDGRYYELAPLNNEGKPIVDVFNPYSRNYIAVVKFDVKYTSASAFSNNKTNFAKVHVFNKAYGDLRVNEMGFGLGNTTTAAIVAKEDYLEGGEQLGYVNCVAFAGLNFQAAGEYPIYAQIGAYYKDNFINQDITISGVDNDALVQNIVVPAQGFEKEPLNIRIGEADTYYGDYFSKSFNFNVGLINSDFFNIDVFSFSDAILDENGNQIKSYTLQDISSIYDLENVERKVFIKYANSEEFVLVEGIDDNGVWDTSTLSNDCVGLASCYLEFVYYNLSYTIEQGENKGIYFSKVSTETEPFFINFTPKCNHDNLIYEIVKWGTKENEDFISGKVYSVCNDCGETVGNAYGETIELVSVNEITATCETDGHLAYKYCPYTNQLYSADTKITGSPSSWVINQVSYSDLVLHSSHNHDIHHEYKDCDCDTDGNIDYYECSDCGTYFVKEDEKYIEIDASAVVIEKTHIWDTEWTVEDDVHYHDCLNAESHTSPVSKENMAGYGAHDYSQQIVDEKFAKVSGNCVSYGEYYTSCVCGKSSQGTLAESTFVPTKYGAHTFESFEYLAPTKESDGHIAYKYCNVCNKYFNTFDEEISLADTVLPKIAYEIVVEGDSVIVTPSGDIANGVNITDIIASNSNKTIIVKVGDKGQVAFSSTAISTLAALGANVTLTVKEGDVSKFEGCQLVLEININGGGLSFGDNAKATITYAFDKAVPSGKVAKVYYVNGDNREDMKGTFGDGKVSFDTTHFSTYIVVFENETSAEPTSSSTDSGSDITSEPTKNGLTAGAIVGIVIGGVILLGACAYAIYYFFIKKKNTVE